jgi:uncharacterized protein YgbK (DUF1537 family)
MHGPQSPRILILADDLSGAADCGVACTQAGLDTLVLLGADNPSTPADVLAVDLDSRGLPGPDAAVTVRRAVERLPTPRHFLFKKIDSTLRGNPGTEIAAARAAVAAKLGNNARVIAVVAPAFPATGRITVGGRILVRGVPLERTQAWRDEGKAQPPDLAAMLRAAGLPTCTLSLQAIRAGALAGALRQATADGVGAVLCDAETETDLAGIAAAGMTLGPAVVWAGSGGLARPLAAMVAREGTADRHPLPLPCVRRRGPVAAVLGSRAAVTREQATALAAQPGSRAVLVTPEVLCSGPAVPAWTAAGRDLDEALDLAGDGGVVVVSIAARQTGEQVLAPALCAALARLLAPRIHRAGALIASGGETARALLGRIGVTRLRLQGKIEPGVPLGFAIGSHGLSLPVVTKAGAFGDRGTLIRCAAALQAMRIAADGQAEDEGWVKRGR